MDLDLVYADLIKREAVAHPKRCYGYILAVLRQLSEENSGADFGANEVTGYFRKRLRQDFGALAPKVTAYWELQKGSDLGTALSVLAKQGCLRWGSHDTLEDYAAQGPLLED